MTKQKTHKFFSLQGQHIQLPILVNRLTRYLSVEITQQKSTELPLSWNADGYLICRGPRSGSRKSCKRNVYSSWFLSLECHILMIRFCQKSPVTTGSEFTSHRHWKATFIFRFDQDLYSSSAAQQQRWKLFLLAAALHQKNPLCHFRASLLQE